MNIIKRKSLWNILILVLISISSFSVPTFAQYSNPSFSNLVIRHNIERSMLSNRVFNNMMANKMLKDKYSKTTKTPSPKVLPKKVNVFEPAIERIVTKNVEDPTTKALYEATLCSYENVAYKDGFQPNDIAYALNYYVVHNYVMYHDLYGIPVSKSNDPLDYLKKKYERDALQVRLSYEHAIHRQFQAFIENHPNFRQMTDRQKQEVAESLVVTTGMLWMLYENYLTKNDKALLPEIQQNALKNLQDLLGKSADASRLKLGYTGMSFQ